MEKWITYQDLNAANKFLGTVALGIFSPLMYLQKNIDYIIV